MKDYLGNEIKAGDTVVKPRAGDFYPYIVARITPKAVILLKSKTDYSNYKDPNTWVLKVKEYRTNANQCIVCNSSPSSIFKQVSQIELDYYNNNYKQKQTL
jgi:hypothetical protein